MSEEKLRSMSELDARPGSFNLARNGYDYADSIANHRWYGFRSGWDAAIRLHAPKQLSDEGKVSFPNGASACFVSDGSSVEKWRGVADHVHCEASDEGKVERVALTFINQKRRRCGLEPLSKLRIIEFDQQGWDEYYEDASAALAAIEPEPSRTPTKEPETGWRPISEAKPSLMEVALIGRSADVGIPAVQQCVWTGEHWVAIGLATTTFIDPSHWQPMPLPPAPTKENSE